MRFEFRTTLSHNITTGHKMSASVCRACKRISFIIEGRNFNWVDGCSQHTWIDCYSLVNK